MQHAKIKHSHRVNSLAPRRVAVMLNTTLHSTEHLMCLQSASNLLSGLRYQGSDNNLYQRNLEAQALLAQQQAMGLGLQGLSSQSALDLLQVHSCCSQCLHCSTLCSMPLHNSMIDRPCVDHACEPQLGSYIPHTALHHTVLPISMCCLQLMAGTGRHQVHLRTTLS